MTTQLVSPADERRDGLLLIAVFIAALAFITAAIGVGLGWRAVDESKGRTSVATASEPVMVGLSEFKIAAASVPAGGSLHVMNEGSVEHNVTIADQGLATSNLAAGASEPLDLSKLSPGTYTMFCSIPGHREAGMEAQLTVTSGGRAGATGSSAGKMDYDAMTKAMLARMGAFPAKTDGLGNQPLEPTKVKGNEKWFDVTAEITKWEVEPGKFVDAWTYNGTVPGPSISADVGDKVHITLHNKLPVASDIHLHGINVENKYDGVAPLTQPLVKPGEEFEYVFTADEVAVAMYHPHFMSQVAMPNGMFGEVLIGQPAVPNDAPIAQRIPMVLNDSGVIGFSLNGKSFPATAPIAATSGDWVLIDYFNEGTMYHPMHLHQFDQVVIAEDGYPVPQPYTVDTLNVGPGNRFTVLVHLDKAGTWVWHCHILPHVEKDDGMFGMVTAVVVS
jgi:manganese oxidase